MSTYTTMLAGEWVPNPFAVIYRDASDTRPYGPCWKAMHVTDPASACGQPVRDRRGDPMEFRTARDAIRHLATEHGYKHGQVNRVWLRRYDGVDASHPVPAGFFPSAA
jgi:hypothetical protein